MSSNHHPHAHHHSAPPEPTPPALEILDPSPVDEDAPYISSTGSPAAQTLPNQKDYFPPQPTTALGLRRNTHNPAYYLHRAQRYASYTFTVFAAFHIANTSIVPLITRSLPESNRYLLLTRPYYQSWPLAEPLIVLAPLAVHVLAGTALRVYRRRVAFRRVGAETHAERVAVAQRMAWPALSGTAALGYALLPLVAGHAALTRGLPVWIEGGSSGVGVDFVGHGVAIAPWVGYAGFAALTAVAGWHITWGWAQWLGLTPGQVKAGDAGRGPQTRRKMRFWGVNGAAAAVVSLWMAGGVGVVARAGKVGGWVGKGYDELYKHVPLLDRWV